MPLTMASLAAKRIARKRTGRAVRSSWTRSSGISRCDEALAVLAVDALDAVDFEHIDADSEDHGATGAAPRAAARREHQTLHVAHRRGQAVEHGARDDRVTDVQLDDLGIAAIGSTLW
jgi:hypothetical protein